MKTTYFLIDYENVQPKNLASISGTPCKVLVFAGANQASVPMEFAKELQPLGCDAQYIRISGCGRNALDFHIAFTIGELSKEDPDGCFHIISKDKGFDPLIQYVRKKGICIHRRKELPLLKDSEPKPASEKNKMIVQHLKSYSANRPKTAKALSNVINALFTKETLSEAELGDLITALENAGHISKRGESVTYNL